MAAAEAAAPPEILSPEFAEDPYPVYRVLRDDFPVYYHEAMQCFVVSRYADCAAIFKDLRFTSDNYSWQLEPVHGRTILQMEGSEHAKHRALLNPFFRGKGLEKFMPTIDRNAAELIQRAAESAADDIADEVKDLARIDIVDVFTTRFPINVIVDMLGLPKSDHDKFHRWYSSIMGFLSNLTQDPEVTADGLRTKEEFQNYLFPIIAERRENPGEDLLSRLCQAEVDGHAMTDEEIKAFCSLLLVAGGETTDKALASVVKNLLEHPEQLEAVRQDRSLIPRANAETLRYSPPVHMIMRQTAEDVEMHGVTMPEGSTVTLLLGSANRDERQFADPDRFDINREDLDIVRAWSGGANHMAFIQGRHFCVGSMLAKAETEVGLNLLLDRFPAMRIAEGTQAEEVGVFTRAPSELVIELTPAGV
jgi:cytochrome P450